MMNATQQATQQRNSVLRLRFDLKFAETHGGSLSRILGLSVMGSFSGTVAEDLPSSAAGSDSFEEDIVVDERDDLGATLNCVSSLLGL
jgi:hypothetical protein